jgi:hypothetical protein
MTRINPSSLFSSPTSVLGAVLLNVLSGCSASSEGAAKSGEAGSGYYGETTSTPGGGPLGGPGSQDSPQNNTTVSLGGAQDIGFFRGQLEDGRVPSSESLDAAGFFAEHHTELPPPSCGERVCLQPMVAVMSNLTNGNDCTMLHLGLNSALAADPGDGCRSFSG